MQIRFRRGTSAMWASANPTLAAGEPGVEFATDGTNKLKIGDGIKNWAQLPYALGSGGAVDGTLATDVEVAAAISAAISALGVQPSGKHPDAYFTTPAQATALAATAATSAVQAVIAGAPAALDTLDELAAALGDNANFATTLTNQITTLASTTPYFQYRTPANEAAPTDSNWIAAPAGRSPVIAVGALPAPANLPIPGFHWIPR